MKSQILFTTTTAADIYTLLVTTPYYIYYLHCYEYFYSQIVQKANLQLIHSLLLWLSLILLLLLILQLLLTLYYVYDSTNHLIISLSITSRTFILCDNHIEYTSHSYLYFYHYYYHYSKFGMINVSCYVT